MSLGIEAAAQVPPGKSRRGRLIGVFARNVRARRVCLGLSEEELADRAQVHTAYVRMIERCEVKITIRKIERIAEALRASPATLLMEA
ncbi:MAG: helix-turn-helix domain-containing protein [Armatimonadota bacterium]